MSLLLLGGTRDARQMAASLHRDGVPVLYSQAGRVRTPSLECEILSGGFRQWGGLSHVIAERGICAILDMTHPYAQVMSDTAVASAEEMNIPCWRYNRPPWRAGSGDRWQEFPDKTSVLKALVDKRRVLWTAGQPDEETLNCFHRYGQSGQKQVLRVAVQPRLKLPESCELLLDIGPFTRSQEYPLFEHYNFDCVVTKNSGGQATAAKLALAREQGIDVLMLARPVLAAATWEMTDIEECRAQVLKGL